MKNNNVHPISLSSNEMTQIILDAMPICGNCWSSEYKIIGCNEETARLFKLKNRQEYIDRFFELSPKYQPGGELSDEFAIKYVRQAFEEGYKRFEWTHRSIDGSEIIPCEVTLIRVKHGDIYIVAGYTRDLREHKETMTRMRKADERTQIMLDATPLCANFWDKNFQNIDCNQEAVNLFELSSKQEYLSRFYELSPELQPCGQSSQEMAHEYVKKAFDEGYCKFEWMHQKVNGEPIPAEITLVRVKYKDDYIVVGYTRDLRELKETMAKMREADERTQIMLDATPLCCNLWDKDFNNIECNQEAVKLFELSSKQEYLDRFFELSPKYQPCGRPTSEMAIENIEKAFNEGYCRFEWMHQKLNGEPIPSEITLVRVKHRDGYIVAGYTRDLRELKTTTAKMREADERTQIMLDATPLCCNLWDKNFNNIECNQEAVKLFELSSKQEYLDRFFELSPKYQPCGRLTSEMAIENIEKAFNEGYCRFEWMHQKLNGEPVPSEITLVRVKHRDEFIVAGYTRDLRELKAMLSEMHKVEADLRLARDAAEESTRAKSEFLANMSHEIRTPMNGILGLLHLVLKTELTPKQLDYLQKTEQSAKALLRIINDILDFSKIEAGKLDMEYIEFNIKSLLEEINNAFVHDVREKGICFQLKIPEDLPKSIVGDPLRLKQILINLINNSIKFTDKGEINVIVQQIRQEHNTIIFQFIVKDTGIGMSSEQTNMLFTPFTQADTSITRKYGGTGLGLAICKNLVGMMDGEINVESELGKGSAFTFTARFQVSHLHREDTLFISKESGKSANSDEIANTNAKNYKILIVEDIEINRLIVEELLTIKNYDVDMAENGLEAVDKIFSGVYDLVLMDIQMPVMDGFSATKKIREHKKFDSLPIIAMSAHAMFGDRDKSLESGMNDHITKPIEPNILYDTLKKWLG